MHSDGLKPAMNVASASDFPSTGSVSAEAGSPFEKKGEVPSTWGIRKVQSNLEPCSLTKQIPPKDDKEYVSSELVVSNPIEASDDERMQTWSHHYVSHVDFSETNRAPGGAGYLSRPESATIQAKCEGLVPVGSIDLCSDHDLASGKAVAAEKDAGQKSVSTKGEGKPKAEKEPDQHHFTDTEIGIPGKGFLDSRGPFESGKLRVHGLGERDRIHSERADATPLISTDNEDNYRLRYEQLKNFQLIMGIVDELMGEKNPDGVYATRADNTMIRKIYDLFDQKTLIQGRIYRAKLELDRLNSSLLKLCFYDSVPVLMKTPGPEVENVFEKDFERFNQMAGKSNSGDKFFLGVNASLDRSITINRNKEINNNLLFDLIYRRVELFNSSEGRDELSFLIRLRGELPEDQKMSGDAGYRIVTDNGDPPVSFLSICLHRAKDHYVEFQVPIVRLIPIRLDNIIDEKKEYPATIKRFKRNGDGTIDNQENWDMFLAEGVPLVENMEPSAPEDNPFTGDFLGRGIAQRVSVNGKNPSTVAKLLPIIMNDLEARAAKNTLDLAQTILEVVLYWYTNIDKTRIPGAGRMDVCLSQTKYFAVESGQAIESSFDIPESNSKNQASAKQTCDREHTVSECEAIKDLAAFSIMPVSFDDESYFSDDEGNSGVERQVSREKTSNNTKRSPIESSNIVLLAGMQRFYRKEQMVQYILENMNERDALKEEIVEGMFYIIDVFGEFNKSMRIPGVRSLMECNVDGNDCNLAFDKNRRQLILFDIAPAMITIRGQPIPGNQCIMKWFESRQNFHRKLTCSNMAKLFVMAMSNNNNSNVEKQLKIYEGKYITNKELENKNAALKSVVGRMSRILAKNDEFMNWCLAFFGIDRVHDDFDDTTHETFHQKAKEAFENYMRQEGGEAIFYPEAVRIRYQNKVDRLQVLANVVTEYLGKIKRDEKGVPKREVTKMCCLSKGINNKGVFENSEVVSLLENMTCREVDHFVAGPDCENNGFYEVAFQWLNNYLSESGYEMLWPGLNFESVENFKSSFLEWHHSNGETLCTPRAIPSITDFSRWLDYQLSIFKDQVCLDRVGLRRNYFSTKIDLLVIKPFFGDRKQISSSYYQWGLVSGGGYAFQLSEYSGEEWLNRLIGIIKHETMILVLHDMNKPYLMDDVSEFHWSAVCFNRCGKKERSHEFKSLLPIEYAADVSVSARACFEEILILCKRLYIKRIAMANPVKSEIKLTDIDFLRRITRWMPMNCVEWKPDSRVRINMRLSSNDIFPFMPLLRAYFDMYLDDDLAELPVPRPKRLCMYFFSPINGNILCFMHRVVDRGVLEVSYMTSNGPDSVASFKNSLSKSTTGNSQVDSMLLRGFIGFCSGTFHWQGFPEKGRQQTQEDCSSSDPQAFLDYINNEHPWGGEDTSTAQFYQEYGVPEPNEYPSLLLEDMVFGKRDGSE